MGKILKNLIANISFQLISTNLQEEQKNDIIEKVESIAAALKLVKSNRREGALKVTRNTINTLLGDIKDLMVNNKQNFNAVRSLIVEYIRGKRYNPNFNNSKVSAYDTISGNNENENNANRRVVKSRSQNSSRNPMAASARNLSASSRNRVAAYAKSLSATTSFGNLGANNTPNENFGAAPSSRNRGPAASPVSPRNNRGATAPSSRNRGPAAASEPRGVINTSGNPQILNEYSQINARRRAEQRLREQQNQERFYKTTRKAIGKQNI